jgi:hypothetical protein
LKIPKGKSEALNPRRTDNTMTKGKRTMIYKLTTTMLMRLAMKHAAFE